MKRKVPRRNVTYIKASQPTPEENLTIFDALEIPKCIPGE